MDFARRAYAPFETGAYERGQCVGRSRGCCRRCCGAREDAVIARAREGHLWEGN
jgi:hypothetical protein